MTEGGNSILNCDYDDIMFNYFQWYRNYPAKSSTFLISIGSVLEKNEDGRFTVFHNRSAKHLSLHISASQPGDSALYLCAASTLCSPGTCSLYSNLQPGSSHTQQYNGFTLTKVSMFSDNLYGAVGGTYTCTVYRGGSTPGAGTAVSTLQVNLPVGLGQWVDWDLTTPVNVVGGEDLWVIWYVNQAGGMGYPAGMCNTDSNPNGDWWNGGEGWENYGGGVWTMRNYFNNRSGREVVLGPNDNAPVAVAVNDVPAINSNLRTYTKRSEEHTSELQSR